MALLTDGTTRYILVSAIQADGDIDGMQVLGVTGASLSNLAQLSTGAFADSLAQTWRAQAATGGTNTLIRSMLALASSKCAQPQLAAATDNGRVLMYSPNGTTQQQWYLEPVGSGISVNGTTYQTYYLRAFGDQSGHVLTSYEGASTVCINPVGFPNGSAGDELTPPIEQQLWVAIPTSCYRANLTVPSSAGASLGSGGTPALVLQAASGSMYPSWLGRFATVQARVRTRTRAVSAGIDEFGAWSDWESLADGSTANLGWGADATLPNVTATKLANGRYQAPAVTLDALGSSYDRIDYEIQAREFSTGYVYQGVALPAHGAAADFVISQVKPLTFNGIEAVWSPSGLAINWDTSWTRGDATVTVTSGDGLFSKQSAAYAEGVDGILVPTAKLSRSVSVGDTVKLTVTLTTPDGATVSMTSSEVVTYTGSIGSALTLTASVSGTLATVAASIASADAWLVAERGHGDRFVKLEGSSPWTIAPPLGVPWKVYATGESGSTVNVVEQTFPAITEYPPAYHVTSQDLLTDLAIALNAGDAPAFSASYKRSYESAHVAGREREVNMYDDSTSSEFSLSGVLLGFDGADEFDAVAHDSHVYVRSPVGTWLQCGVTSASIDMSKSRMQEVSVSFVEEVW